MTKSILFLSVMNGAAWGGSEEWWYRLAPWMASNGYKVEVVWFFWEERAVRNAELKAGNVVVTPLLNPAKASGVIKKFVLQKKLTKQIASIKWDSYDLVVINQGGFEDVIHGHFKHLYKKLRKYILVCHNFTTDIQLRKIQKDNLQNWFNKSSANLGASEKIFTALLRAGIEVKNNQIITNPITFPVPAQHYQMPGYDNGLVFIMLAALDIERKAQDTFIRALGNHHWKNRKWQLHLYGEGKDKQLLTDLIIENRLEENIFLHGHTTDVISAIRNSHVLFQITNKDAMPLAVCEAMAVGRPCIVSNVGDMAQWVQDGENGFVCSHATVAAIEDVLEKLWYNKNLLAALGKKSFEIL